MLLPYLPPRCLTRPPSVQHFVVFGPFVRRFDFPGELSDDWWDVLHPSACVHFLNVRQAPVKLANSECQCTVGSLDECGETYCERTQTDCRHYRSCNSYTSHPVAGLLGTLRSILRLIPHFRNRATYRHVRPRAIYRSRRPFDEIPYFPISIILIEWWTPKRTGSTVTSGCFCKLNPDQAIFQWDGVILVGEVVERYA